MQSSHSIWTKVIINAEPDVRRDFGVNSRLYFEAETYGMLMAEALQYAKEEADQAPPNSAFAPWPSDTKEFHDYWSSRPYRGEYTLNGFDAVDIMNARNIPLTRRQPL